MAIALYRLGRWCARHAAATIVAWVVVLLALGGAALGFGSKLTSVITIPGSDFVAVADRLKSEIPEAAGGMGTVVLHTEDGKPFTAAQQKEIKAVFGEWTDLDVVTAVQDPFVNQATIDDGNQQLVDAKKQIDDGQRQIDAGWEKVHDGEDQLEEGRGWIFLLRDDYPDDPGLARVRVLVAEGRAKLNQAKWDLHAAEKKLAAGQARYDEGVALSDMVNGQRFVSKDGAWALAQVQFTEDTNSIAPEVRAQVPELGERLADAGVVADYSVEITQENSLIGMGEVIGLAFAALVLVIVLGSLIAAGLPILVALLGVGTGLAAAMAATFAFEMNSMTPALALMLGLAVGIDYALFIVNRHRTQLLAGMELHQSIGRAVGTAGNAVIVAGATVIIALGALSLTGIPILGQMGFVAAGTVAMTVAVAITMVPAVLRLMGSRVVSRRGWRRVGVTDPRAHVTQESNVGSIVDVDGDEAHESSDHGAWVTAVTRHPWAAVLGVLAIVAVTAIPAASLRLGLPDGSAQEVDSTAYAAYQQTAEHFGAGSNGPIVLVASFDEPLGRSAVTHQQALIGTRLTHVNGVEHVIPFGVSKDRDTLAFQVLPATGPAEQATSDTVVHVRGNLNAIAEASGASEVGLTGMTVANLEISQRLADALPIYLAVVIGLSLLLLVAVFQSVIVPLLATAGFLLSVAASFGAAVAVYQWGWLGSLLDVHDPGPILPFMPIILIGVLFGLAMDYQMFLVSGMREAHAHGSPARLAVRQGFRHGARVVTAAAIIMISVFGGFVFAHMTMIRPIGFGLAVGVLVDAFLVRMTLTPAVMHMLGERAWWMPAWLKRVMPDLDVEGTRLSALLEGDEPATEDPSVVTTDDAREHEPARA
ncbi:MMPL family transporter [Janibacter sp. G56]|uniref:MMPL family transporter n=1 Tax=Janibacter sp. G56 TaxID=3418717 RepID=UPI003D0912FD